ncbi:hypothetical protein AMTRI_Chr08g202180 [Amborella trichopoda]
MVTLTQLSQVSSINLGFLAGNTSHCHRKTSYLRISRKNGRWFRLFSGTSAQLQDWDCSHDSRKIAPSITPVDEKPKKLFKKEHHLWMKRDSAGSSQKALNLVRIVSRVSNEKEAIYVALDEWAAWETEFPVIAAAKALGILRKRRRWLRVIQVSKWLLSKGQVLTMGTYDTLLLAFDMDGRVDEAETIWNMILHTYTRSISKRLFSRMMSLYDHHHIPDKLLEVFADMEELGVKPDQDSVRRVARAFQQLGEEEKQKQVLQKYGLKLKYIHFNGERVRIKAGENWDE